MRRHHRSAACIAQRSCSDYKLIHAAVQSHRQISRRGGTLARWHCKQGAGNAAAKACAQAVIDRRACTSLLIIELQHMSHKGPKGVPGLAHLTFAERAS